MYSAFQSNSFQNNAFQIVSGSSVPPVVLLGGGPGEYHGKKHKSYSELRIEQSQAEIVRQYAELKRVEHELAEAELSKQAKLAAAKEKLKAKNAAKKLAALEVSLQEEINRLRIERVWLMRMINDEETILVILLSYPLH